MSYLTLLKVYLIYYITNNMHFQSIAVIVIIIGKIKNWKNKGKEK